MEGLRNKSFLAVVWSFADSFIASGISFVIGIVLARLLMPEDFGLIGMVTVLIAFASVFVDSGFSVGLIRKLKCSNVELSTAFYFNITISIILYIALFISSPLIASFFNQPELSKIIKIFGLILIIDSFAIIQRTLLIREIDFKRQTKISFISAIIGGIVGIALAFTGYGVWSVVFQILSKQFVNCILLWLSSQWRPQFIFSTDAFLGLFKFGSKMLGSGIIVSIQNNIYYFIIGKYFTAASLGYFTRAEQFNSIVTGNLTGTFERVFFPVLSSMQDNNHRLKYNLKKTLRTSFFITYYFLILLAIIANPLVVFLIGDKWLPSVPYLQLLCIGSVFFPFNVVNSDILKIKGRSDLILRLQLIKTFLTLFVVAGGIMWGITVMLVIRVLTTLIATIINSNYSGALLDYSLREQMKDILPYFMTISAILLPVYFLNLLQLNGNLILLIQVIISIVLFIVVFEKMKFVEYVEIKAMIIEKAYKLWR